MYLRILGIVLISAVIAAAQTMPGDYEVSAAGKFSRIHSYDRISDNGEYSCTYTIKTAGDEVRELTGFTLYHKGNIKFNLDKVPGSDMYISNSGITAFLDHTYHFKQQLTINFFSPEGSFLNSLTFTGAYLFGFSPDGNTMGIGTPGKLLLYNITEGTQSEYPGCMFFDVSNNGSYLVAAGEKDISVYRQGNLQYSSPVNDYVRKIVILDESSFSYITRDKFIIRSLQEDKILYSSSAASGCSFTDLLLTEGRLFAGMNKRGGSTLTSYFTEFTDNYLLPPVKLNEKLFQKPPELKKEKRESNYDPIPWPFFPFDSARTAWNHYEQNMGWGGTDTYLHQGLDLIVPINEPTYSVTQGFVKLVLTTGGESYWRVAISPVNEPGRSNGWLHAHLIQNTIPVFTGDTVTIHEHLGNIIVWSADWGHIHFVEINDSGAVWLYSDNEWGINFNPYLALDPLPDTTPPMIQNSSMGDKFEFCKNETSVYLSPDSLYDKVDIIVRVVDYIGASEWQQPAYKSYYWIKSLDEDSIVYQRKLGHILNHPYEMYASSYYEPYAKVLYKVDATHPASSWMSVTRNYYHILTNNDGDELLDTTERHLALDTELFYDGNYRIYVELLDPSGNSTIDSMDVIFINGVTSASDNNIPVYTALYQNYPNPFNASTVIRYRLANSSRVQLKLYDLMGSEVAVLSDEYQSAGDHQISFNSDNYSLASGLYFYRLTAGEFSSVKKLMLLK